jgi:PAS domain S-box-containing protein
MPGSDIARLQLLEAAVETTGSVVLGLRPDHTIFFWNREAELLYGLPRDQAYGKDYVATFIAPEQRDAIAADIRKVLAGEPTWNFEDDSVLADGRRVTLVWNVRRVDGADGAPFGIVASGFDITARKEAELKFRLVWDQSTEGLLIGGGPGIVDCNPAALQMLGLTDRAQLIGRHPMEFSPELQPDGVPSRTKARAMDTLTAKRGELRFEWMHQRLDGTPVPTSVHVRRATLNGRMVTVVAWLDRTEQHAIEQREAALNARMLRAQKLDALGHLAGGIAHDFNNLLSAIRGSLELAQIDVPASSPASAELAVALDTTVHAASLVRQLLTFGRHGETSHTIFDLREHVLQSERLLRRLLRPEMTLTLELVPNALYVSGDKSQLEQVLVNLVVNARDAIRDGGSIVVRLTRGGGDSTPYARLEVIDNGPGMPAEVLDRVFDPFFTTKPVGAGTGLGLSVVYGVVSAHDGLVHIESSLGQGTTVRVDLPLCLKPAPEVATAEATAEPDEGVAHTKTHGELVLLVEDEAAVRRTVQRLLEHAGYQVISATHGAEALTMWHARADDVRVVLSDVRMPVMSGPEFVRQLRVAGSRLPVVLMSGFADAELTRSLPVGVRELLQKPFATAELFRAIREALAARTD